MKTPAPAPDRSGIALIITMGFLAIIAIMAVAFAITMRVERLVARSFADGVRARNLVHVGLARALEDIHGFSAANNLVYPDWANSSRASAGTNAVTNTFFTGAVTNYIPGSLLAGATANAANVRWVNVTSGTNLVGRYGYLAVNCSGLLDPHGDYNTTVTLGNRTYGITPYELTLTNAFLNELIGGSTNPNRIYTGRIGNPRPKAYGRAESIADLWIVGGLGTSMWSGQAPFQGSRPVNLFPFSYYPRGFKNPATGSVTTNFPLYIGGAALPSVAEIQAAFNAMGGTAAANSATLAGNLGDYLDADWTPHNVDTFSAEPVPMINEIIIENGVTYDSGTTTWNNQVRMRVELFYPFALPTPASGFQLQFTLQPVGGDFGTAALTETVPVPNMAHGGATEFYVHPRIFNWTYTSTNAPAMPTALRITALSVLRGVTVVDRVRTPVDIPWAANFHASPIGAGTAIGSSWAVDDPRINWDWASQWIPAVETRVGTPGGSANAMNPKASATLASAGRDGHRAMFARQSGAILVPGELGFLLHDPARPWQTIPLLGNDALPVLDYFTTSTQAIRRGLVNLNSENRNVLAQVVFNMPIERWPGEGGAARVTTAQATALAQAIYNGGGVPNQYVNVSDIKRAGPGIDLALPALDTLQKKALIRNSSMLFGTRQNVFTIVVIAQSVVDANGDSNVQNDEIVGEQRALAVVWRDPYRDGSVGNTTYESFVRFFRWLDK